MVNESKDVKIPVLSRIAYGFGDVGCNFSRMFVSNFLMIFIRIYSGAVMPETDI